MERDADMERFLISDNKTYVREIKKLRTYIRKLELTGDALADVVDEFLHDAHHLADEWNKMRRDKSAIRVELKP